jgi:hypothetical protein
MRTDDLLRPPLCIRRFGGNEMNDFAALLVRDDQHVEQPRGPRAIQEDKRVEWHCSQRKCGWSSDSGWASVLSKGRFISIHNSL